MPCSKAVASTNGFQAEPGWRPRSPPVMRLPGPAGGGHLDGGAPGRLRITAAEGEVVLGVGAVAEVRGRRRGRGRSRSAAQPRPGPSPGDRRSRTGSSARRA